MLMSTKKIIDSADDVLRSSQALLKSTESGTSENGVKKGTHHQPPEGLPQHPREKRQKKKKSKVGIFELCGLNV